MVVDGVDCAVAEDCAAPATPIASTAPITTVQANARVIVVENSWKEQLETESHRQLHLPRSARADRLIALAERDRRIQAVRQRIAIQPAERHREVRVVEQVEHVRPELQLRR